MYFTKLGAELYADFENNVMLKVIRRNGWQVRLYTRESQSIPVQIFAKRTEAEKYMEELAEKLNGDGKEPGQWK